MTTTSEPAALRSFTWPEGFARIPDEGWVDQPVDPFGLSYDDVDKHSWYKNLQPMVAQVVSAIDWGSVLVDYSSGTGIVTRRVLEKLDQAVGVLDVDPSPKFLRVALENLRFDERVAFRQLHWLKEERRLQRLDEVVGSALLDRGVDALTAANAIHLYTDLAATLESWAKVLRPGGKVFVCSANVTNPAGRPGDWIIDETVAAVNEIAQGLVRREPSFARYRDVLDDDDRMSRHVGLREKVFVPVRPLDFYLDSFSDAGFKILDVFESTIFATVEEWSKFLCTYHDGVLSWIGGSPKIEGHEPSEEALDDRRFLIRYSLERLFSGQESFPCSWTYITCKASG